MTRKTLENDHIEYFDAKGVLLLKIPSYYYEKDIDGRETRIPNTTDVLNNTDSEYARLQEWIAKQKS